MSTGKRFTFGVLVGLVNTGYYKSILTGILDFVREKDCNLHCFATSNINSTRHWKSDTSVLFSLADKANIDGLIAITTALENYVENSDLHAFFSSFDSLPVTSIGEIVAGAPSFVIDNEKGLLGLLAHLTDDHGFRRLVYVSGPSTNTEAEIRLATYRRFLDSRGIPFNPDLIFEGDFTGRAGKTAVQTLFAERKVKADVLVAANDLMALGAIEELKHMGLRVPGDLFVTGFDDIEISADARLTTVRQPLREQGYAASSALYRLCRGEIVAPVTIMPTGTVVRSSCGCRAATPVPYDGHNIDSVGRRHVPASPVEPLLDVLDQSLAAGNPDVFLERWRQLLFRGDKKHDPVLWESIIEEMMHFIRRRGAPPSVAQDIIHQAHVLVSEAMQRQRAEQRIVEEIQEEHFSKIDLSLNGVGSLDEQLRILATEMPALGIDSCYLSLYTDIDQPLSGAKLIFAYEDGKPIPLPGKGISFPPKTLIPAPIFPSAKRHDFIVKSLEHREINLGFILMELGNTFESAGIFDTLSPKLSSVLQLSLFIEDAVRRTEELKLTNMRLDETNRALEEFALLAAHEMQEPLRKILTFGERLADTGDDVLNSRTRGYLDRMTASAVRMRKLIDSLIAFSQAGTATGAFESVNLEQMLTTVLSELEPMIKNKRALVKTAPLPAVMADPSQMHQLFGSLIDNALKFHKPGTQPFITVTSPGKDTEGRPVVVVEDDGIGISPRYHRQIFGVFQRLHVRHEFEGDGIGLALCKRIMDRHNGTITVESEEGGGTRFIIRFAPSGHPA